MLKQNRTEPQRQTVTFRGFHPAAAGLFSVISFWCSLSREKAPSHVDLEALGQVLFLVCFVCVLLVCL